MDHNLEDSLNYDGSITVDFADHSDSVVTQNEITLEGSSHGDISMEYEHIEEQQILIDTGGDTVIVPELMTDQFMLTPTSDYSIAQTSDVSALDTSQTSLLSAQGENMMDIQFEPQTLLTNTPDAPAQLITLKTNQVRELSTVPRQVAIAPKPPAIQYNVRKQVAIAPKPQSIHTTQVVLDKSGNVVKKLAFGNLLQSSKGVQQVYGQMGKQLVVIPSGGQKKLKLVQSGGQPLQAQLIRNPGMGGKISAKVIIQGQSSTDSNQPAVITKLKPMAATTSGSPARYVTVHSKTVPISHNSKMVLSSPPKQTIRLAKPKQQIVKLKSPTPKIVPIAPQVAGAPKKLVISGSGQSNVMLKEMLQKAQVVKSDGKLLNVSGVSSGQRTQLHQINIPGKGVQYIRLVTNSNPANAKPATPKPPAVVNAPPKTILLADGKGNLIQMPSKKLMTQPPPLVVTSSNSKPVLKAQQKLVRIAPVAKLPQPQHQIQVNTSTANPIVHTGSQKSLLAPVKCSQPNSPVTEMEETACEVVIHSGVTDHPEGGQGGFVSGDIDTGVTTDPGVEMHPDCDTKEALRALVEETTRDLISPPLNDSTGEIDYQRNDVTDESTNSADLGDMKSEEQRPLIVIPSYVTQINYQDNTTYLQQFKKDVMEQDEPLEFSNLIDRDRDREVDREESPTSPRPVSDNELEFRPRKPCNCAKSQCLKLYCDCFANGEFCNNCNCNCCHNNLDNEELRQKAIRACLDRNPNAFRPKIGKAQNAGPEPIRRHNKGCNCKNCGCLKNYCECYEAKIACTSMCKCVGCRNVEESVERARRPPLERDVYRHPPAAPLKHPCNFMTLEVIEAVCQCLLAAAAEGEGTGPETVLDEFSRCLQDIVGAAVHPAELTLSHETLA